MERIALQKLIEWNNNKRKKPLIGWGARQVGKTYLIQELFAKEYYKNRQLKCVKKIQNVYGYKILTVTELYDESGKPLPIPSGTF